MAIQAVLDGVGVAVAQLPYVSDALASGRLVTPFPIVDRKYEGWYLAYRRMREKDAALLAFRNWLHGEAGSQRQIHKGLGLTRPLTRSATPKPLPTTVVTPRKSRKK